MPTTPPPDDGATRRHARDVTTADRAAPHPLYCVWEITLACDLGCKHCGSRAGPARPNELSTEGCLDVVRELDELGIREVTLIGGEAYLREDWDVIAAEITRRGMICGITTGARNLTPERIQRAVDAGVRTISVSIDGLEATHDAQRGSVGSWRAAVDAARAIAATPMRLATNSQINRLSMPELPAMASLLREIGSKAWQIQLTVPMGHGADRPDLLLQPYELLELYPLLVWVKENRLDPHGISLYPGNNIGYFGPYEQKLRFGGDKGAHWQGCSAGEWTLGLEADGKIKGCPSLPSSRWTGGMLGQDKLAETVANSPELTYLKNRTTADLWGFCKGCYYADICKAGCTWTSYVFFNRDGNNPYCIHRAMEHDRQGQQERLTLAEAAPGEPFDNGRFAIGVEPAQKATSPDAEPSILGFSLDTVQSLTWDGSSIWSDDAIATVLGGRSRRAGRRLTQLSLGKRPMPDLPAEEPLSNLSFDVAQRMLREQCVFLYAHAEGLRTATERTEAVVHLHQFRVALRRTRSVLSLLRDVFPPELGKRFRKMFRWMGRFTGPVRDIDVWLEALDVYMEPLNQFEQSHLAPLLQRLEADRAVAHKRLMKQVNRKRFHQTLRDWEVFIHEPYTEPDRPPTADVPIGEPTSLAIANLYHLLVFSGAQVTPQTADGAVHAVRIEGKKLRYLVKLFGPLVTDDTAKMNSGLRKLQRCLGAFNDHSVQLLELQRRLPEIVSDRATTPEHLVAVGQLMGHLRTEKTHDREQFVRRMAQVSTDSVKKRYLRAFGEPTLQLVAESAGEQVDVAQDSNEIA